MGCPRKAEAIEKFQTGLWSHKYELAGKDNTHRHTKNVGAERSRRVRGRNRPMSPVSHPRSGTLVTREAKAGRGTLTPYAAREGPPFKGHCGALPPEAGRREARGREQGEARGDGVSLQIGRPFTILLPDHRKSKSFYKPWSGLCLTP